MQAVTLFPTSSTFGHGEGSRRYAFWHSSLFSSQPCPPPLRFLSSPLIFVTTKPYTVTLVNIPSYYRHDQVLPSPLSSTTQAKTPDLRTRVAFLQAGNATLFL